MTKRLILLAFTALVVSSSCSHELEGPSTVKVNDQRLLYCQGERQTLVVSGSGLSPMVREGATDDPEIDMPDVCLIPTQPGGNEICIDEQDVQWVSQNEVRFDVTKSKGIPPGEYNVIITNPDGTKASGTVTLKVLSAELLVFWADPSVVYNGISTRITVYGTGLDEDEFTASGRLVVIDSGGTETPLGNPTPSDRNNRVEGTVGSGLPPGDYDVVVRLGEEGKGCVATLEDGLSVTDIVDLSVTSIDPSFGWTQTETPVTIRGAEFEAVPRAYLNPVGGTDVVATAFQSMGFLGADRVTGVVPSGLPPGVYDVIVVNPNRRVGRLEAGFTVTPNAAPIIENISPNFVDTGSSAVPMTIEGSGFDNPTVTADCLAPDGTTHTPPISVVSSTGTEVSVTLDTTPLVQGEVCVIRVTNADGAYFEYSAIGLSNPASNLAPWRPGPEMTVARRAPAVASARATRAARFIYAIGGDDGSAAGAMASVESAAIDVYGEPTAWFAQPVSLPEPRTLANVVTVGRFLYLVGGNVAGAPTNTVLRAQVLNPEDAPEIVDVTARRGENASEGIGRGVWTYRVSAVMADTDPSNPGGETLPSEPLVVTLNRDDTIVLTLIWDPVPGAKAYRVYRSATGTGDLPLGNEVLMAEVPAPADASQPIAYEDVGAPAGAQTPRPLGATGVWMSLPNLDTAREAPGVTAGRDPADPTTWHVYAVGGLDATGAVDSYERLAATIQPDQSHTLAASWAVGASMLSAARSELTAYAVSHSEAPQVAVGTTYIYAAGGRESTNVDVATVAAGGELTWAADRSMGAMRAGYAGVAGAGFLFVFGGAQGVPTDTTQSGEINPTAPPALINWNASERMTVPRYFAGGAIESAFIYVVGGQSTGGPTPTIERTVL